MLESRISEFFYFLNIIKVSICQYYLLKMYGIYLCKYYKYIFKEKKIFQEKKKNVKYHGWFINILSFRIDFM